MAHILVFASYSRSLISFRGDLIRALVTRGHQVTAAAPQMSAPVINELRKMNVRTVDVPLDRTGLNPVADFVSLVRIYGMIRKIRPDVVFAYTAKPVIYGSLAASLAGVRQICSMITGMGYAFDESRQEGWWSRWLTRRLYRLALGVNKRVLFQNPDDLSDFLRARCLSSPSKAAIVNGSGVDLQYFAESCPPRSDPVFLMIARLLVSKGVREYVEAARIVRRVYPRARFMLVGWRENHPASIGHDELEAWRAEGVIEYCGPADDVRPYLRQCSVYVLPSYREGTPRTVLEAMSTGRAIITTNVPGCKETVIDGVNGFLVPPCDSAALAEAIMRFAFDSSLIERMGRDARLLAERKYDVRRVTRATIEAMEITN